MAMQQEVLASFENEVSSWPAAPTLCSTHTLQQPHSHPRPHARSLTQTRTRTRSGMHKVQVIRMREFQSVEFPIMLAQRRAKQVTAPRPCVSQ
jgi:hypothetical protein